MARKYVRIALTEGDKAQFSAAKSKAEQAVGMVMSDSMYALMVLRKAIQDDQSA